MIWCGNCSPRFPSENRIPVIQSGIQCLACGADQANYVYFCTPSFWTKYFHAHVFKVLGGKQVSSYT